MFWQPISKLVLPLMDLNITPINIVQKILTTMASLQLKRQFKSAKPTQIAQLLRIGGEAEEAPSGFAGEKKGNELAEGHTF